MNKVRAGDPLKIPAKAWNDIVDAVDWVKLRQQNVAGVPFNAGFGDGIVRVQNTSAAAIPVFTVVSLTSHAPSINYDNDVTKETPDYYTGILPSDASAPYAVTQEEIAPGAVGRAMVYGITPVKFAETSAGAFADPSVDAQGQMLPSASGSARILAAPTTSNPWGVVLLGCGGGGGGSTSPTLEPWQIVQRDGVLYVVDPQWSLNAPYGEYPTGASAPTPEAVTGLTPATATAIDGVRAYALSDVQLNTSTNFTRIYARLQPNGVYGVEVSTASLGESPACLLIATLTRDATNVITSISQARKGAIASVWMETERFYVVSESSGDKRYAAAPTGLAEGTLLPSFSYWKLQTSQDGAVVALSEELNNASSAHVYPYPQAAIPYDAYIYRYGLHYDSSVNGLVADTVTTPVINVAVSPFARIVPSPFVERIQVVYPTSPIEQGSVDAVGGTINVLAVESPTTEATTLFRTESIDTQNGNLIEEAN